MADSNGWQPMSDAPQDGTRVLVTVRSVEQGPAEVDMAYWARADRYGPEGWRAADSSPGCVIAYADPELKCWMPLPNSDESGRPQELPPPYEGEDFVKDGAGI
ncbi:MAG: hypothetical protein JJ913_06480 [Rhizobiaceae bacterium]|nr:hypothetical protein [Rhizobiaceae bacterium]